MIFSTAVPQINQAYTPPQPTNSGGSGYGMSAILGDVLGLGEIGAGIALTATGAGAAAGVPLMAGGAGQLYNTNKQYLRNGTGYNGLPAGSHESGNDLTLVHSKTGQPTNIKMEGDEILVGSENSKALRDAVDRKDKEAVYNIFLAQMAVKPKKYDGKMKMEGGGDLTNIGGDTTSYFNDLSNNNSFMPTEEFYYPNSNNQSGIPYAQQASTQGLPFGMMANTASQPNNFNFANPSNPIGYSYKETQATPQFATPNKWGYLASALPGVLQTIYGLSQSDQTLPQFHEPAAYSNYVNEMQKMSTQGFSPAENALYNRDLQNTYDLGLQKVKQYSGGNGATVLSNLSALSNSMNEAKLKGAAEDKQLQRQNMLNYGSALGTEAQLYNLPQQEWLMRNYLAKQQNAYNSIESGLGNLEGAYMNYLDATDQNRIRKNNEINRITKH